jgi:hypothetical protein
MGTFLMSYQGDIIKEFQQGRVSSLDITFVVIFVASKILLPEARRDVAQ